MILYIIFCLFFKIIMVFWKLLSKFVNLQMKRIFIA